MADNVLIVQIDLQNVNVNKPFEEIEERSGKTAQIINQNVGVAISQSVKESNRSVKETASSISQLIDKIKNIVSILTLVEKKTGIFSSILKKAFREAGISFDSVKSKAMELLETIKGYIAGEKSLLSLKVAIGFLLREFGEGKIIVNKFLEVLRKTSVAAAGFAAAAKFGITSLQSMVNLGLVAASSLLLISERLKEVGRTARAVSAIVFKPQGLFGITTLVGDLAIGFGLLSVALGKFDNAIAQSASKISLYISIALGGLATALTIAINKVAQLSQKVGNRLVEFFQKQTDEFNKAERSALIFAAAIDAVNRANNNLIGSSKDLEVEVRSLAEAFNVSNQEALKAAQEVVLVGSRLGLTRDQILKTIEASLELAKINKKEIFQTTVNVVNALNGNAQALAAYGIKLNEASVKAFALKNGLEKKFSTLKDGQKVQIRYNKFLGQYAEIAGVGLVAASSLADQSERLERNIQNLNRALGQGARIVEDNNILNLAYNAILENVSDSVFTLFGFFGALGSRILQIGGYLLELSFKFFVVNKAIKVFNTVLASESAILLMSRNITFLGMSIDDLISQMAGMNIKIRSSKDLLTLLAAIIKNSVNTVMLTLTGTTLKTGGAFGLMAGAVSKAKTAITGLLIRLAPLLIPLVKIAAIVGLVVAGFKLLVAAFEEVEERTKVVSDGYKILVDSFKASTSIFSPIIKFFTEFRDILFEIGRKAFGRIVDGIAAVIGSIAALVKRNPLGIFSAETAVKFAGLENRINSFRDKLKLAGFDLKNLAKTGRAVAGETGKKTNEIVGNFSLSFGTILNGLKFFVNEFIFDIIPNVSSAVDSIKQLFGGIRVEFTSTKEDLKQQTAQVSSILKNGFVKLISGGIQNVVESLRKGENAFENFVTFVLNTIADLAIQLGSVLIFTGLGILSLETLKGAQAVAAGTALVALGAAIKAFTGGSASSGGGSIESGGGDSQFIPTSEIDDTSSPDDIERQTTSQVNINIEGSLVQQEELGTFISEILSESNEKNGNVIVNPRFA